MPILTMLINQDLNCIMDQTLRFALLVHLDCSRGLGPIARRANVLTLANAMLAGGVARSYLPSAQRADLV